MCSPGSSELVRGKRLNERQVGPSWAVQSALAASWTALAASWTPICAKLDRPPSSAVRAPSWAPRRTLEVQLGRCEAKMCST